MQRRVCQPAATRTALWSLIREFREMRSAQPLPTDRHTVPALRRRGEPPTVPPRYASDMQGEADDDEAFADGEYFGVSVDAPLSSSQSKSATMGGSVVPREMLQSTGSSWGGLQTSLLSEARFKGAIGAFGGRNGLETLRRLMRFDARPWNLFVRLNTATVSLNDADCAKLLLWTADIVQLESDHGRRVHALQMGYEMASVMLKGLGKPRGLSGHQAGPATVSAVYRLCEAAGDLSTAYNYFAFFSRRFSAIEGGQSSKRSPSRQNPMHSLVPIKEDNTSPGEAPTNARLPPEILLHLVWLVRVARRQPNSERAEEIADIVRTLYAQHALHEYGALPERPRDNQHLRQMLSDMHQGAAAGEGNSTAVSGGPQRTLYLGMSPILYLQHCEIFGHLLAMRTRIECAAAMDPDADHTTGEWIAFMAAQLGLPSPSNTRTLLTAGANSKARQSDDGHNDDAATVVQTGRWLYSDASGIFAHALRSPQPLNYFPHLGGNVPYAPIGPLASECASSSLPECVGDTMVRPPSWDRPYLFDSLLRDDVIRALEDLAFSFSPPQVASGSAATVEQKGGGTRKERLQQLVGQVQTIQRQLTEESLEWTSQRNPREAEATDDATSDRRNTSNGKRNNNSGGGRQHGTGRRQPHDGPPAYHFFKPCQESNVWRVIPKAFDKQGVPVVLGTSVPLVDSNRDAMSLAGLAASADGDVSHFVRRVSADPAAISGDQNMTNFIGRVVSQVALTVQKKSATTGKGSQESSSPPLPSKPSALPAEIYHYLLVALIREAPVAALTTYRRLRDAGMRFLDITVASMIVALLQQVGLVVASPSPLPRGKEMPSLDTSIGTHLDTALERLRSDAFRGAAALLRDLLGSMDAAQRDDTTHGVSKAVEAYWTHNYPTLLYHRNRFHTRAQLYDFLLPGTGVSLLVDLLIAAGDFFPIYDEEGITSATNASALSTNAWLLPRSLQADALPSAVALHDLRQDVVVTDAHLCGSVRRYLLSLTGTARAANASTLWPSDQLVTQANNRNGDSASVEDYTSEHVVNLLTGLFPKLDISLMGAMPCFERYCLGEQHPTGGGGGAFIASSLEELRQRLVMGSEESNTSPADHDPPPSTSIFLVDASFMEGPEHVRTLLRLAKDSKPASRPLLLFPYLSLAQLAETASGADGLRSLDAKYAVDGALTEDEVTQKEQREAREKHVNAPVSRLSGTTGEMQAAARGLSAAAALIARAPRSAKVLHLSEQFVALGGLPPHTMRLFRDDGDGGSRPADAFLLRTAAALAAMPGGVIVHVCTDDPGVLALLRQSAALREALAGVRFVSSNPLLTALLRPDSRPPCGHSALGDVEDSATASGFVCRRMLEPDDSVRREDSQEAALLEAASSQRVADAAAVLGAIPESFESVLVDRPKNPRTTTRSDNNEHSEPSESVLPRAALAAATTIADVPDGAWMSLLDDDDDAADDLNTGTAHNNGGGQESAPGEDVFPQDRGPTGRTRIIGDFAVDESVADGADVLLRSTGVHVPELILSQSNGNKDLHASSQEHATSLSSLLFHDTFFTRRAPTEGEMVPLERVEAERQERAQRRRRGGSRPAKRQEKHAAGSDGLDPMEEDGSRSVTAPDDEAEGNQKKKSLLSATAWSTQPLMQDHLSNVRPSAREIRFHARGRSKRLGRRVSPSFRFRVFEANVNDPRNAALLNSYETKRVGVTRKRAEKYVLTSNAAQNSPL